MPSILQQIRESLSTKRPSDLDIAKARIALGGLSEVTHIVEQVAALLEIERASVAVAPCKYCGFTAGEAESEFTEVEDARGVLDHFCGILFGDSDTTYDSLDEPATDVSTRLRALIRAEGEVSHGDSVS